MNLNNLKKLAIELFPLNRSLAGKYNRQTLTLLKKKVDKRFSIKGVKSGLQVYSWKIPYEYNVTKGLLKDDENNIICDLRKNNLHVVTNSVSVNKWINYSELKEHLYSTKKLPYSIPYVTSYYKKTWGFCIPHNQLKNINKKRKFKVEIKSNFYKGKMNYSELIIKGKSKKEILICSYICHPALANNELSGILGIALLAKKLKKTKYTIRLLLIPETIGAIYYVKKNLEHIKKNLILGINLSCIGIDGPYTLISTISGNTYADKIIKRVGKKYKNFKILPFDKRASNERQFGCQNLNLPFVSLCRKKFGDYKEYHTSADNLEILNFNTIISTVDFVKKIVNEVNSNKIFKKKNFCEPFLAKTNLIDNVSTNESMRNKERFLLSTYLAYIDENNDLKSISEKLKLPLKTVKKITKNLQKLKIIEEFI